MTPLKEALQGAAVTQAAVASAIGVATNTVYLWAAGKKPLPADRAVQIGHVLGVDPSRFASMVSSDARGTTLVRGEPRTMLDFVVQNMLGGRGDGYRPTVLAMAQDAGVSVFEVRSWLAGEAKIPLGAVQAWAERFPGFNPVVLCYEVAYLDPAAEQRAVVRDLTAIAGGAERAETYDEALAMLSGMADDFLRATPDIWGAKQALDNGRPTSTGLMQQAARFAKGRHLVPQGQEQGEV